MKRILALALTVAVALASPVSNVFEIDISPEEAQRYLANLPFNEPQLSGKTATLPLVRWNAPNFRTAEAGPTLGHYWKNGHEIENTEDYVEDVYEASQFHGQDGLGQYAYGYSAPESAKVENREHSGDVKGTYTYRDPNNQLIQVRYWADHEGFHQEDNLPKVELQPAQETEEVRQARLAHEKAWQEAADAAKANPDPQGEYDPKKYEYDTSASEQQNSIVPSAADGRQAKAYQGQQTFSSQSQYSQQGNQYNQQASQHSQQQQQAKQPQEPEPTGSPRGFFYSFNYPVSILVAKSAQGQGGQLAGSPVDHDTVGVSAPNYG